MKTGIELIAIERIRQVKKEGWTKKHDSQHKAGELARAGASYALADYFRKTYKPGFFHSAISVIWPFELNWFKDTPRNRIKELVKAGGLIAAEIDRLQNT